MNEAERFVDYLEASMCSNGINDVNIQDIKYLLQKYLIKRAEKKYNQVQKQYSYNHK